MNNDKIVVYQFANNHTEYIDINGQHCMRKEFYQPWRPTFEWIKDTHSNGTCSFNGKSGTKWSVDGRNHMDYTLCADANIPISFDLIDTQNQVLDVAYFLSFVAGVPSPSSFQMPARCYTRPLSD